VRTAPHTRAGFVPAARPVGATKMSTNAEAPQGQPRTCLLRRPGPPEPVRGTMGVQIDDERLAAVLDRETPLLTLYDQALHSEGPIWQPERERLIFSDIPGRRVMAWYPDGRVEVAIDATPFINGNALDGDGALIHCEHLRRCISRSDTDGIPRPFITHYEGKRLNTPNDITTAKDGTIWFTDPIFGLMMPRQGCLAEPELDHRSVYRYDPATGELRRMADFDQPNGLFFSPDGTTLYVSDTSLSIGGRTHEIVAFDVAPGGALSGRRFFSRTDHGVPDGFAVDRRGWLWSTAGDGLHIYAPDGHRLGFIPAPITTSNCAFGGVDGRRLFITAETHLYALDLKQPGV